MTANDNAQPSRYKRSGSERRQRGAPVSVRFLPDERAAVEEKAREVGLTLASFLRASVLGSPGPRARRVLAPPPAADGDALSRGLS